MCQNFSVKNYASKIDKKIFNFLASYKPSAVAVVTGGKDFPQISGIVEFYSLPKGVMVIAEIDNLPLTETNIFAFHIHEGQSCTDNFSQTGGHFNPNNTTHPKHSGDLPPLFSNGGSAWQAVFTNRFQLDDIIGRVAVIHHNPDDFTSQPAGNSGEKIACGKIEKI